MAPKFRILCYVCTTKLVCTDSMGHSAGAHETLEMLDGILDSFDHLEQGSTEQGRGRASKVECCSVKCWVRLTRALHYCQSEPQHILITFIFIERV